MSISSPKPSAAADGMAGFTLLELMVALGIAALVTMAVTTFIERMNEMYSKLRQNAELEDLRSIYRGRVDCSAACGGLKADSRAFGKTTVDVTCSPSYNDARVTYRREAGAVAAGALFTLDEWVCKPRRPRKCIDACHNNGAIVERGYFFPSLDHPTGATDKGLKCPSGSMIGVDFGLGRILCDRPHLLGAAGPRCLEEQALALGGDSEYHVGINGLQPCYGYDQLQTRTATLGGTLMIDMPDAYTPAFGDNFEIVVAQTVSGHFRNVDNGRVSTPRGTFLLIQMEHGVVLTGFTAFDRVTRPGRDP